MGYARIVSELGNGRYTVELDYGSASKESALAQANAALNSLNSKLNAALETEAQYDAEEAAALDEVEVLRKSLIDASNELAAGSPFPDQTIYKVALEKLAKLQVKHAAFRLYLSALRTDITTTQRFIAYWNAFDPIETRNAWCVTLTTGQAGGWPYRATVEIPGESNLILLAEDCRAWTAADGQLQAREVMRPDQAYFNAAILPGWQKEKPTYRWGTITNIDYDANVCNVTLASALSSAQSLDVNKSTLLTDVPIVYMTCNAVPFAIEDRVIIKFVGQSWDSPVVIGFLDNPKPCIGWSGYNALLVARGISGPPRYLFVLFQATDPQNTLRNLFAEATLENMTVDYRVNRSGWNTIPVNDENNDPSHWEITDQFLNVDITPGDLAPVGGGTAFVPSLGEPPYVRVGFFINSGWAVPEFQVWPYGAVLEVRIKIHGDLFANVAIKASFAPFEADCNISIQPGSNLTRLDYVRFEEDGT